MKRWADPEAFTLMSFLVDEFTMSELGFRGGVGRIERGGKQVKVAASPHRAA